MICGFFLQKCSFTILQFFEFAIARGCCPWFTAAQMGRCTFLQFYSLTVIQMHSITDSQSKIYSLHWDSIPFLQLHSSTVAQFFNCTNAQLYKFAVVQIDSWTNWQLYKLTVVQIDSFTNWQLYILTVVNIDSCTNWQLYERFTDLQMYADLARDLQTHRFTDLQILQIHIF